LQDKEYKLREHLEKVFNDREQKLNDTITNLKEKIENEAVNYNNRNYDFKLETESKN
jgi:hypothetical protein